MLTFDSRRSASGAAGSNYQVNVSRQKTKKWVEAKSQNYDGDDWGADEYEDDEPALPPPPQSAQQGHQYGAQHQHAANVPALHIQTNPPAQPPQQQQQQQHPQPPAQPAAPRHVSNPPSSHPSAGPQSAGGFQPQSASSAYALSPRSPPDSLPSSTPQAAVSKPLPFVRPSDIYRRMEEEKSRASSDSSRPSAEIGSNLSKHSSASPARSSAEPVKPFTSAPMIPATAPMAPPSAPSASGAPRAPVAPVAAVAPSAPALQPRTDSHNDAYKNLASYGPPQTPSKAPAPASMAHADAPTSQFATQFATPKAAATAREADQEAKHASTSPKLPDLARMSVFGADLFSSTGFSTSLSSEQMAAQNIPSIPQIPKVAPELKVDNPVQHAANPSPAVSTDSSARKTESASAVASAAVAAAPGAMANAPTEPETIKPTVYQPATTAAKVPEPEPASSTHAAPADARAPVESAKQAVPRSSIDTEASSRSAASAADITPTKPLNVRKEESPVRSFEPPPPLHREPTFGTDTSSPVKESDVLRDEIIKTLNSPTQNKTGEQSIDDVQDIDAERKPSQSRARDSSYTLRDYDSYWEETYAAPQVPPEPVQAQSKTMSVVPEESVEAVAAIEEPAPVAEKAETVKAPEPATAPEPLGQTKTEQETTQPLEQAEEPEILSPSSAERRRRFSWEAEDSSKPSTAVAPAAAAIPAVAAGAALAAAAVVATPGTQTNSQPTVSSPREVKRESPAGPAEANRLSLADEKTLSQTTSNQISTPPADDHPALRLSDPAPVPSLSMPTRSSVGTTTPFKEIMGLNNSTERINKFNESRVSYAVMDIGLDRWLTSLHQDHPEHHSKSFNSYQPGGAPAPPGPPGAQPPAQQPYYQQYLNASTPGTGSSPGRRIGGISMPSTVGGSTFGHSGNQIGTKSKELMHSAGKMGKGLFSKGKSKFLGGGSGDKVFH